MAYFDIQWNSERIGETEDNPIKKEYSGQPFNSVNDIWTYEPFEAAFMLEGSTGFERAYVEYLLIEDEIKDVGLYTINAFVCTSEDITLEDTDNYQIIKIYVEIVKASNEITDFIINGWQYGENPIQPSARSKFGDVYFKYSTSEGGTYNEEVPTDAGIYFVKAIVDETENYLAVESQPLQFEISKIPTILTITDNFTEDNPMVFNYDGLYHNISINASINHDKSEIILSRQKVREIGLYQVKIIVPESTNYTAADGVFYVRVRRSPTIIDNNEVINIIKNSLLETMDENYYYYKDYNVILAKEQEFIKLKQAKPNAIYIVIKFGSASINFSQTVLPITLTAMSEQNKLDVCQKLLSDFVNKYNLETNEDSTIRQIYELPVVTSNFNKVFEGFRSILFVNGYFVISKNANFYELESAKNDISYTYNEEYINNFSIENDKFLIGINNEEGTYSFTYSYGSWYVNGFETNLEEIKTKYGITFDLKVGASMLPNSEELFQVVYDNLWETVPLLSFNFNADFQLDSQPFFNRDNFSHSKAKYGVLSFNINTYMLSDIDIVNKALNMALKQKNAGIDSEFKLKIKLKNGIELIDTFKLLSLNSQQTIAEIPVISLGFTN